MVHYGKHIIDRATGLCEICDRGAIYERRKHKRTGRQFLYTNQDGKFTYRPNNDEKRNHEETTPRRARKSLYPEPTTARSRPVVYEEPVVVPTRVVRREYSPPDDIEHRPRGHPATLYYVDHTGQMLPRNGGLKNEPRQRDTIQNHQTSPARPTRVVHQRAQTPPRRQLNHEPEVIERPYVIQTNDNYHQESPRKANMYYIDQPRQGNRYTALNSLAHRSQDDNTPPPKVIYQENPNRKQRQLEPLKVRQDPEQELTVVRRVYKKLPRDRHEPLHDDYVPNGDYAQPVRKIEKFYPPPKQYVAAPQSSNRHMITPLPDKSPSIYYIQSTNAY